MPGPSELLMQECHEGSYVSNGHQWKDFQMFAANDSAMMMGTNGEVEKLENKIFTSVTSFIDYFVLRNSTIVKPKTCHIAKVLIATNGIAAVKCITSMRKMLQQIFQNDKIVKFICLTTEQEVQSQAGKSLFLREGLRLVLDSESVVPPDSTIFSLSWIHVLDSEKRTFLEIQKISNDSNKNSLESSKIFLLSFSL